MKNIPKGLFLFCLMPVLMWPFALMIAGFSFDSPIKSFADGLLRTICAVLFVCYPAGFIYGCILSSATKEENELSGKAVFWLYSPWMLVPLYILIVIISAIFGIGK